MQWKYSVLFIILLSTIVIADDFESQITTRINTSTVTVETEGGTVTYGIPESGQVNNDYNIELSRTCDETFNYTKIDEIVNAVISTSINESYNLTEISLIVNDKISEGLASQQDWIRNTYVPTTSQLNNITNENTILKNQLESCERINEKIDKAFTDYNATHGNLVQSLKKENNVFSWSFFGIILLGLGFVGYLLYERFNIKPNNRW